MNINLQIENFRNELYNLVANNGLPISIVYYIYKNIGQELENTYFNVLNDISKRQVEAMTQQPLSNQKQEEQDQQENNE